MAHFRRRPPAATGSALPKQSAFGTPEVCQRKDAGGIFSRRKVPSQEREPKVKRDWGVQQKHRPYRSSLRLVRQKGLEPPTYCLEGSCSIRMSYWRVLERVMGIEPTPTAWKAVVLAVILHPQEQASASAIKSYHKRTPLSRQFFLFLRFLMKNVSPASPGIRTAFSQTGS